AEVDAKAEYPWESHRAFVDMGLMGLNWPEEYGGSAADEITWAICIEEIARVCASSSLIPLISTLGMTPVVRWASDDLKQRTLPRITAGQSQASYCLSEAEA